MHDARRPLIGSASGGVYRHGTRTSTKIRPDHGPALRGPDKLSFSHYSCENILALFTHGHPPLFKLAFLFSDM